MTLITSPVTNNIATTACRTGKEKWTRVPFLPSFAIFSYLPSGAHPSQETSKERAPPAAAISSIELLDLDRCAPPLTLFGSTRAAAAAAAAAGPQGIFAYPTTPKSILSLCFAAGLQCGRRLLDFSELGIRPLVVHSSGDTDFLVRVVKYGVVFPHENITEDPVDAGAR